MRATQRTAFLLSAVPSVLVGILLGVLLSLSAPSVSTTHVNDAGTWRQLQNVYVNDAGTWREIQEIYVNDSGTWRSVFSAVQLNNHTVNRVDGGTPAEYHLQSDGLVRERDGSSLTTVETWTTGTTSDYESRATVTSGSLSSGSNGVWENLGTTRSWSRSCAAMSSQSVTMTMEIRRASDSVVVGSATITIICDRS